MEGKNILLIDQSNDSAALLDQALASRAGKVKIDRCSNTTVGIGAAALGTFDLVVVNRTSDANALTLVQAVRKVSPTVPLLVIARTPQSRPILLKAGASEYLTFADWSRIGPVVERLLEPKP